MMMSGKSINLTTSPDGAAPIMSTLGPVVPSTLFPAEREFVLLHSLPNLLTTAMQLLGDGDAQAVTDISQQIISIAQGYHISEVTGRPPFPSR